MNTGYISSSPGAPDGSRARMEDSTSSSVTLMDVKLFVGMLCWQAGKTPLSLVNTDLYWAARASALQLSSIMVSPSTSNGGT